MIRFVCQISVFFLFLAVCICDDDEDNAQAVQEEGERERETAVFTFCTLKKKKSIELLLFRLGSIVEGSTSNPAFSLSHLFCDLFF